MKLPCGYCERCHRPRPVNVKLPPVGPVVPIGICDECAEASFTCPRCGAVSHHPLDAEHGYCGRCHDFTGGRRDEPA